MMSMINTDEQQQHPQQSPLDSGEWTLWANLGIITEWNLEDAVICFFGDSGDPQNQQDGDAGQDSQDVSVDVVKLEQPSPSESGLAKWERKWPFDPCIGDTLASVNPLIVMYQTSVSVSTSTSSSKTVERVRKKMKIEEKENVDMSNTLNCPPGELTEPQKLMTVSRINPTSLGKMVTEHEEGGYLKPPLTFTCLNALSLRHLQSPVCVGDMYKYLESAFPYFRSKEAADSMWKNSLRHNLSQCGGFLRSETPKTGKKGSTWTITQDPVQETKLKKELKSRRIIDGRTLYHTLGSPEVIDDLEKAGLLHPLLRKRLLLSGEEVKANGQKGKQEQLQQEKVDEEVGHEDKTEAEKVNLMMKDQNTSFQKSKVDSEEGSSHY